MDEKALLLIAFEDLGRRLSELEPHKAYYLVNEDELRAKILEFSPELRRDTEHMADLIRELVKLEREKRGFDNPRGIIELYPNKEKTDPAEPDFSGSGRIAGRFYQVGAWIKAGKVRIALAPPLPK